MTGEAGIMFLRCTPVLCIAVLFLLAAPAPHSMPLPLCPSVDHGSDPPARGTVLAAAQPTGEERSSDRTTAIQAQTMRAVLRELLPGISLVATLPFPHPGTANGLFPFLVSRSRKDAVGFSIAGSGNRYSGLSPPI